MSPDALSVTELHDESDTAVNSPRLPEGWAWASLGEILPLEYGKALPERLRDSTGKVAVYGSSGRVGWHTAAMVAGPTLIVGRKGSAGAVFYCDEDCWPIDTVYFAKPKPAIDLRYGFYFLKWKALGRLDQSTAIPSLSRDIYSDVVMPVAPLSEQRRIVARIDELFAEIDEGEAALQRARQGLDTWRRALLKAAVTGELTRDWREANRPAETGADLLARIRAERRSSRTHRTRWRRGAANSPLDVSALPELPRGWVWARLSELGLFGRGKSKHRPRDDPRLYGGDVPFIQTGVVAGASDHIKTFHQTYSELGVAQSQIWPSGTLCITIAANIANTAILAFGACFPDSVVGLVPNRGVDTYFIHMWMQTIQSRLEAYAPATAQKNINLEVLHNVAVPLPPTEEQSQIVGRFRTALDAFRDCDEIVKLGKDRDALRQSILKAAFEGWLVPQHPTDEPVYVLLARLRQRRPAPRRSGRGRPRAAAEDGPIH